MDGHLPIHLPAMGRKAWRVRQARCVGRFRRRSLHPLSTTHHPFPPPRTHHTRHPMPRSAGRPGWALRGCPSCTPTPGQTSAAGTCRRRPPGSSGTGQIGWKRVGVGVWGRSALKGLEKDHGSVLAPAPSHVCRPPLQSLARLQQKPAGQMPICSPHFMSSDLRVLPGFWSSQDLAVVRPMWPGTLAAAAASVRFSLASLAAMSLPKSVAAEGASRAAASRAPTTGAATWDVRIAPRGCRVGGKDGMRGSVGAVRYGMRGRRRPRDVGGCRARQVRRGATRHARAPARPPAAAARPAASGPPRSFGYETRQCRFPRGTGAGPAPAGGGAAPGDCVSPTPASHARPPHLFVVHTGAGGAPGAGQGPWTQGPGGDGSGRQRRPCSAVCMRR